MKRTKRERREGGREGEREGRGIISLEKEDGKERERERDVPSFLLASFSGSARARAAWHFVRSITTRGDRSRATGRGQPRLPLVNGERDSVRASEGAVVDDKEWVFCIGNGRPSDSVFRLITRINGTLFLLILLVDILIFPDYPGRKVLHFPHKLE